jgi:hypothetical protein
MIGCGDPNWRSKLAVAVKVHLAERRGFDDMGRKLTVRLGAMAAMRLFRYSNSCARYSDSSMTWRRLVRLAVFRSFGQSVCA